LLGALVVVIAVVVISGLTITSTATAAITQWVYVSSNSGGTVGGIAFADEDILRHDPLTGTWEMYIDGSDIGLGGTDINAFEILANGDVLLSVDTTATLPTVGKIDDSDIVRFTPTSTGDTTAGSFSWYFDGSDVELTTDAEDIDGLAFAPDGRLLISVTGSAAVTGIAKALDEDVIAFTMTRLC
jgi:hypothetical protein